MRATVRSRMDPVTYDCSHATGSSSSQCVTPSSSTPRRSSSSNCSRSGWGHQSPCTRPRPETVASSDPFPSTAAGSAAFSSRKAAAPSLPGPALAGADRRSRFEIEELQLAGVDDHVDDVIRAHLGLGIKAPDERRALLLRLLREVVEHRLFELDGALEHLVRDNGLTRQLDVGQQLGSERLRQQHPPAKSISVRAVADDRRVLELLGTDTERDLAARI